MIHKLFLRNILTLLLKIFIHIEIAALGILCQHFFLYILLNIISNFLKYYLFQIVEFLIFLEKKMYLPISHN